MDNFMHLRSNIEYLLKKRDSNPYRLQEETNIPQPTIQRILSGETDNPRQKTLQNLSLWSGYSVGDLLDKDLKKEANDGLAIDGAMRLQGMIPVINEVQAGIWSDIKEHFMDSDALEWVASTRKLSRAAFGLYVVGDSMFNQGNPKSMTEGQIAIVEPEAHAMHRDVVVARLAHTDKGTIKQLLIDGDDKLLSPLNQNYKPIVINEDVVIVGVVMDVITRFR